MDMKKLPLLSVAVSHEMAIMLQETQEGLSTALELAQLVAVSTEDGNGTAKKHTGLAYSNRDAR